MKHGIKLRKLHRTPSHRWALLRNLVSALLHHETIKTTLPKAKETARLAEKIITLGKKGTDPAYRQAMAFLMPSHSFSPAASANSPIPPPRPLGYPSSSSSTAIASSSSSSAETDPETFEPPTSILPKLFQTLSERYADRPGGYTRIHRFGRRKGDNAPHAILELVDGPRDLKYEMVARAVGRERAQGSASSSSSSSVNSVDTLRGRTQENMSKVLRYRSDEDRAAFARKADEWAASLAAEEEGYGGHRRRTDDDRKWSERSRTKNPYAGRLYRAGEKLAGMTVAHSGLGLARGDLGRKAGQAGREPRFLNETAP